MSKSVVIVVAGVSGNATLKVAFLAGPSMAVNVWKKLSDASYFLTYSISAGT